MASTGIVKFFNQAKGFGFIETDHGDVFVHANDVQGQPLQEGDEVHYDEMFDEMKQKSKASNVTGGTGMDKGFGKGGKFGDKGGKFGKKGGFGFDKGFGGKGFGKSKGFGFDKGYDKGFDKGYGKKGGFDKGFDKGFDRFDNGFGGKKGGYDMKGGMEMDNGFGMEKGFHGGN
eukprot:g18735.t1